MYLAINILGLIVFLAIGWLFSKNRKAINWKTVAIMVVLNLILAWFLTGSSAGRAGVKAAADGFVWIVDVSAKGTVFALGDWYNVKNLNFICSALMPILMIVPLFDILTYIGFLPWIIKWIGRGLSYITGQPKFESFFAVEMMFLGNTEVLAVSGMQIRKMGKERNLTLAMMSMSCVTASILGAYIEMMPGQYILTAVPINIINALIATSMLNPVSISAEEDTIEKVGATDNGKKEPFFSFLGDSILGAGKLILIIVANVVAFVALAALIDKVLALFWKPLSLESILGVIMFPFSWLLGLPVNQAWDLAQNMGMKLVTNEFVVMGKVTADIAHYPEHLKAVLTVFVTSFANFGTLGMIIGAFKGLANKEDNDYIASNIGYLLLSGILVSLLSAAFVGLFVW
ncbi:NupC/NupG family nucleoside CNT transporter [Limosilactobacillus panis]|uniref:Nucleoside transporter C-terminal domain-containing protein n=1 Tax=Limosilactobacillus panis TaxID=47493 RepID=A0ABT7VPC6_9LACO|nr:nucleoside transporter C-terminal domain-containing protein [Limosilactobacillus panis]MDM8334592.1 nucleoside transporter C-terminal domain-containing protein [Limosilactobacillus panis]HJA21475.1 NupC/NupG family nucleoside CNT transporter [Candidatus Limosilactobacillus intestinipullorum]